MEQDLYERTPVSPRMVREDARRDGDEQLELIARSEVGGEERVRHMRERALLLVGQVDLWHARHKRRVDRDTERFRKARTPVVI